MQLLILKAVAVTYPGGSGLLRGAAPRSAMQAGLMTSVQAGLLLLYKSQVETNELFSLQDHGISICMMFVFFKSI